MNKFNPPLVRSDKPGSLDLTNERIGEILDAEDAAKLGGSVAALKQMETADLRAELSRALGLSARHLVYLAAVWAELESRGEDLTDLRRGWWAYVPRIAAGAVLPEAVAKYAGQPTVLRAVAQLPPAEQRRLVDGEPVTFVVRQGDGFTHRMLPAHALTAAQTRQVFGDGVIRSEAEQIALLTVPAKPPKPGKAPKRGRFRADRSRGVVLMGRKPLQPADLVAALADLYSPESAEEPGDDAVTLPAKLTPDEHRRLKVRAAEGNTSLQSLVRNALRSAGLI